MLLKMPWPHSSLPFPQADPPTRAMIRAAHRCGKSNAPGHDGLPTACWQALGEFSVYHHYDILLHILSGFSMGDRYSSCSVVYPPKEADFQGGRLDRHSDAVRPVGLMLTSNKVAGASVNSRPLSACAVRERCGRVPDRISTPTAVARPIFGTWPARRRSSCPGMSRHGNLIPECRSLLVRLFVSLCAGASWPHPLTDVALVYSGFGSGLAKFSSLIGVGPAFDFLRRAAALRMKFSNCIHVPHFGLLALLVFVSFLQGRLGAWIPKWRSANTAGTTVFSVTSSVPRRPCRNSGRVHLPILCASGPDQSFGSPSHFCCCSLLGAGGQCSFQLGTVPAISL